MKFMKLGTRHDTFYTNDDVRSISSEVSSDLILEVNGTRYLLHKFPLLSKCLLLQNLCPEPSQHQLIQLPDFPGGTDAFELCAKFCYGVTITISAFNILTAQCAAEYLAMTENVEKGNLMLKLQVFFNSCLLNRWKDSIITLKTTKTLPIWSEEHKITAKCIESIASKVLHWPSKSGKKSWWGEDMAELEIDHYWRTIIAIKSGGKFKFPPHFIGDALTIYASRWLPSKVFKDSLLEDEKSKLSQLLDSIVSLLPVEKGAVSCSFLFKLLKVATKLNTSSSSKTELAKRIGVRLDEATVSDLLIPSCMDITIYNVDIVIAILEQFMLLNQSQSPQISPPRMKNERIRSRSCSAENLVFGFNECSSSKRFLSTSYSAKFKVAKLIDRYLQDIALDENLTSEKFLLLAESVPRFSRLKHDDLYRAIDIFLKVHPNLEKRERKRVCGIIDCKKLSMDTCADAATNERLPLRVVVQVLCFEQARAVTGGGNMNDDLMQKLPNSNLSTLRMKLEEEHDDFDDDYYDAAIENLSGVKAFCLLPNRPKRMFSKLWSIRRGSKG